MFSFNLPPKVHSPRSIPLHHLDECMKAFKGYVEAGIMKTKTDKWPTVINMTFLSLKVRSQTAFNQWFQKIQQNCQNYTNYLPIQQWHHCENSIIRQGTLSFRYEGRIFSTKVDKVVFNVDLFYLEQSNGTLNRDLVLFDSAPGAPVIPR